MHNIKLTIEYCGANFTGWQKQTKKQRTVQEVLEKALQKIFQQKIRLIGSGRTDAGVSALAQVANFKINSNLITLKKLQRALNANLPDDIVINQIEEVSPDFHSRFNALSKLYRYTILNRSYPGAILKNIVYFCSYPLDIKLMQRESRVLLGKHNFKSFKARDKIERKPVRTIKKIKITQDKDLIYIDIEADGFLYNMVRNIVGTLIEIGRGKLPKGSLKKILQARDRKLAGPTVPACGLCLLKVKY